MGTEPMWAEGLGDLLLEGSESDFANLLNDCRTISRRGKVVSVIGTTIRVTGIDVNIGQQCDIFDASSKASLVAEVVGFDSDYSILLPLGESIGISSGAEVVAGGHTARVPVSELLLGRVLDGSGQPLDELSLPDAHYTTPLINTAPNPLSRSLVDELVPTGIKAIDSIVPVGLGQRVGIFAAAGTGKSTLLGMIAQHAPADVVVVALIGERGREVREFIEFNLGAEGRAKSIVVVSTSDRPAVERVRAAHTATAIAEAFRDQGKRVLLLMDSVTRYARALREVGLSVGEPAVRQGYPPSVFAELPKLFERAGNNSTGSITAFYTTLVEDENVTDPIAEEVRSILDGHIILSRQLANQGYFPAIDINASASRVFKNITSLEHRNAAHRIKQLNAAYEEVKFLIQVGEYQSGSDPIADEAILKRDAIRRFLCQEFEENIDFEEVIRDLMELAND